MDWTEGEDDGLRALFVGLWRAVLDGRAALAKGDRLICEWTLCFSSVCPCVCVCSVVSSLQPSPCSSHSRRNDSGGFVCFSAILSVSYTAV